MGAAKIGVSEPGAVHDDDFIIWWRTVGIHEFPYEMREALVVAFRAGSHGNDSLTEAIEAAVSSAIGNAEDRIVEDVISKVRRIIRKGLQ